MIILHAFWDSLETGSLHVWAESSHMTGTGRKRSKKSQLPPPHPFVLDWTGLSKEFINSFFGEQYLNAENGLISLLFPTSRTGPLPSTPLLHSDGGKQEIARKLSPWLLHSLEFLPDAALEFLFSLPGTAPTGIRYGPELRFWMEAAKFSLELCASQSFVPIIDKNEDDPDYHAQWNAVITEKNYHRLSVLTGAMPPCCRAFHMAEQAEPPESQNLIVDFLNATIDAYVRKVLSEKQAPILSRRKKAGKKKTGKKKTVPQKPGIPERWLNALSDDESVVDISGKPADRFYRGLQGWLLKLLPVNLDTPFRTCFRVEEPAEHLQVSLDEDQKERKKGELEENIWKISYHLQAKDDRTLLVPAEHVWKRQGASLGILEQRFENPQERLLADLGRASIIVPQVEQSLQTPCPWGMNLEAEEVYTFLREYAPLLEQNGFGVLMPPWWNKPVAQLGIKLSMKGKADSSSLFGLGSIIEYDWQLALGDQTFSQEEFQELARLKTPLVKFRGKWVQLREDDIEKAIAFFRKKKGTGEMELGQALRVALGDSASETGFPVVDVSAEGWVAKVFERLSGKTKIRKQHTPKTLNAKLRPYQGRGYSWLQFLSQFGFGACLADDMGLGKTIQFITLMLKERHDLKKKERLAPTLVVCPMSVVENWKKEIERFAPSLSVMVHHGQDRLSGENFLKQARQSDVVISTYALIYRDLEDFEAQNWRCVALDEAQNIKNPSTKQTKAVKNLLADYRVALTGTPVENRLSELWSIMDFLNPGYLSGQKAFHKKFAVPIEKYRDPGRAEDLKKLIQPFVLRRLKSDPKVIRDLPEKMEMKVFCNLCTEQASLYEAVVEDMLKKIEDSTGIKRKGAVLAALTSLKQVCNHPALYAKDGSLLDKRSGKLSRLSEMLEEVLAEGDKALIFTQYAQMGNMLRSHLQDRLGVEVVFLHGGSTKKQRDAMVTRFQEDESGPHIFVLSLKAGGLGLNLTAANHVFHFDRWWNPAVEDQATDRAFRIGQKKNVQVHKFICAGTLEEKIDEMIEQKKELAGSVVGTGEGWLTELSTDSLRDMFALNKGYTGGD